MNFENPLNKLPVAKLDAARRQLETAITLWFHEADPVSIHTLAGAAHKLLYDIKTKAGGPTMLPDADYIRPGCVGEWRKILSRAQNFFKHADKDSTDTLFFAPQMTQYLMLDACNCYRVLAHEHRPLFDLFAVWFTVHEPRLFSEQLQQQLRTLGPDDDLRQLSKLQFFRELLPAASIMENT
jgi:hypothetical protein